MCVYLIIVIIKSSVRNKNNQSKEPAMGKSDIHTISMYAVQQLKYKRSATMRSELGKMKTSNEKKVVADGSWLCACGDKAPNQFLDH